MQHSMLRQVHIARRFEWWLDIASRFEWG